MQLYPNGYTQALKINNNVSSDVSLFTGVPKDMFFALLSFTQKKYQQVCH